MRFIVPIVAALAAITSHIELAAAAPAEAVTAVQGQATFVTSWVEDGLQRYRFTYSGVDGDSFVHAFQNCFGITNNWQNWNSNGQWYFDDSEVLGVAGARVISCGINAVTGQDCESIDNIGC